MAEILGNELLIKALGKKGWREVKRVRVCLCVCGPSLAVWSCLTARTDTVRRLLFTVEMHADIGYFCP